MRSMVSSRPLSKQEKRARDLDQKVGQKINRWVKKSSLDLFMDESM